MLRLACRAERSVVVVGANVDSEVAATSPLCGAAGLAPLSASSDPPGYSCEGDESACTSVSSWNSVVASSVPRALAGKLSGRTVTRRLLLASISSECMVPKIQDNSTKWSHSSVTTCGHELRRSNSQGALKEGSRKHPLQIVRRSHTERELLIESRACHPSSSELRRSLWRLRHIRATFKLCSLRATLASSH